MLAGRIRSLHGNVARKGKGSYIYGLMSLEHLDVSNPHINLKALKASSFLIICVATSVNLCSLTVHSDLGIGGLQFGGQPLSAGTNGAGHYGMLLLHAFIQSVNAGRS